MYYMPILPIGMFDVYDRAHVKDVFILPQYWGNNDYREYYTGGAWRNVIIDNAMYEQPDHVRFGELLDIAGTLTADRIFCVTPEDMRDGRRTCGYVHDTVFEYGECGERLPNGSFEWEMMVVLHGTPFEMRRQYHELAHYRYLAYGLAVSSWREGYDRGATAEYINFRPGVYIHAMGWDSILEALNLRRVGVNSIDSSMAASAAVNSINLKEQLQIVRKGLPTDPKRVELTGSVFGKEEKKTTLKNLIYLRYLCEHGGDGM